MTSGSLRASRWLRIKALFVGALDVSRDRRRAFVRRRAAGDDGLHCEVVRLLALHERTTKLLAAPGAGRAASVELWPRKGMVLRARYALRERIGAGAFGAVFRARDRLVGEDVAVKLRARRDDDGRAPFRDEVAALRRARLPGVATIRDEGSESGWSYIVMDLVTGSPFPGLGASRPSWQRIEPQALDLLAAVGRLHALGVVHRDLKPANVLVARDGCVTIVDLGIASDADLRAFGDVGRGWLLGTPGYLAPERLLGGPGTRASDLYACGVMIAEALAGPATAPRRLAARLRRTRGVPRRAARTLSALLHRDPLRRPRSAREASDLLRDGSFDPSRLVLPPLGERLAAAAIMETARAGRSVDVVGSAGCGKSRAVADAAAALAAVGVRVERCRASRVAGGSLRAIARDARALRRLLGTGAVVVADPWDALDPTSRRMLGTARRAGAVIRATRSCGAVAGVRRVRIAPLAESDLRALFEGPERVHHLPGDAARELFRATAGNPRRCERTLLGWIDAGVAQWEGGRCRIDRPGVELAERMRERATPARSRAARAADLLRRATACADRGNAEAALLHLGELVRSRTRLPRRALLRALLCAVESALFDGGAAACDAAQRVVAALAGESAAGDRARALIECERLTRAGRHAEAAATLGALRVSGEWSRLAMALSCVVASRDGRTASRAALVRAARWARTRPVAGAHASFADWLGRHRYVEGRYVASSGLHRRARRRHPAQRRRVSSGLHAASAALEAGSVVDAQALALDAVRDAAACRFAPAEARAEWLARCAAYRLRRWTGADEELLDAVRGRVAPGLAANILLQEAAHAWRAGHRAGAAALAAEAARTHRLAGRADLAALADALARVCGGSRRPVTADAARLPERLRRQAVALVLADPCADHARWRKLAGAPSSPPSDVPAEVLSDAEVLDLLTTQVRAAPPARRGRA